MEIYLKRTNSGFTALYDSDYQSIKKIKVGEEIKAVITRPRNYKFHKKYFALLNLAFENQDQYDDIRTFRYIIQMKAGYYKAVPTEKNIAYIPESISFSNMDEYEFGILYNKVIDVIIKYLNLTKETIENELINFM